MHRPDDRFDTALLRPSQPPPVPLRIPKHHINTPRERFDAARLRPSKPLPPPPKTPLGSMQDFRPLPGRLLGRPPRTSSRAFPIHLSLNLMPPASGGSGSIRMLCTQVTTAHVSPSHHYHDVLDQLLITAETNFGLDLSERSKWRYSLLARCQDYSGCVTVENAEFVISASSQGGWTWTLMLVEVERSRRGVWESVETYSVPRLRRLDAGFFDQRAMPGSEREV